MPEITVKSARLLAGMTQQQVADGLNIGVQTYRKLEQNPEEMTIRQALTFSYVTSIPIDSIIFAKNSTLSRVS